MSGPSRPRSVSRTPAEYCGMVKVGVGELNVGLGMACEEGIIMLVWSNFEPVSIYKICKYPPVQPRMEGVCRWCGGGAEDRKHTYNSE
jgi:hypothetical protein